MKYKNILSKVTIFFSPGLLQISLKTWNKIPKEDQIILKKQLNVSRERVGISN